MRRKKKNVLLAVAALLAYLFVQQGERFVDNSGGTLSSAASVEAAFSAKQSDTQVLGQGVVVKVLPDDRKGLQHQKFILRVSPDQTVLVAHNIDQAPRIPGLKKGDTVEFYGEYEWTRQGGVVHWTHRSSGGSHVGGWLKKDDTIYQ